VQVPGAGTQLLHPTEAWQTLTMRVANGIPTVDENFYVTVKPQ